MYKLSPAFYTQTETSSVIRTTDSACIPFDPANTDAKEFALWLQAGSKPEPAEEGDTVTDEWVAETIAKLLPNQEGAA
jgi:hypothetical protein